MPFVDATSAAPSRRPYALESKALYRTEPTRGSVIPAFWLGRRNGRTTVSLGVVRIWWHAMPDSPSWEECLANADGRYGGDCFARWDGESLWTAEPVTPERHAELAGRLDEVLRGLPDVPNGSDRWRWLR